MRQKGSIFYKMKWEGLIFSSIGYGDFTVQDYISCDRVVIKFKSTGNVVTTRASQIKTGYVKDIHAPTVCGVGVVGGLNTQINGKRLPEYKFWQAMLIRCYDDSFKDKNPSYKNCVVSDNFKSYPYFHNWCQHQKGFGVQGWQLDKDLLGDGLLYSEDTCVFIPQRLNSFFKTKDGVTVKDCLVNLKYSPKVRLENLLSILEDNCHDLDNRVKEIVGLSILKTV